VFFTTIIGVVALVLQSKPHAAASGAPSSSSAIPARVDSLAPALSLTAL
jgi:hypothetical protein